jgi:hypothetical protein
MRKTLAVHAGASSSLGVTADVASASVIRAGVSVKGAGTVETSSPRPPVGAEHPWIAVEASGGGPYPPLEARPASGWTFAGWTGCPPSAVRGNVRDLRVVDGGSEGVYGVRWTDPEPGLTHKCSLDGRPALPCDRQLSIDVGEGDHELRVGAFAIAPLEGAQVRFATFAARSDSGNRFECSLDGGP